MIMTSTQSSFSMDSEEFSELVSNFSSPSNSDTSPSNLQSLGAIWAKKYYISVTGSEDLADLTNSENFQEVNSPEGRAQTANKLHQKLTLASARAWSKTETLLSEDIRRHGIDPDLINPLQIAADTRFLFEKVLNAYANSISAQRVSVVVAEDFGQVRHSYTKIDPRAIGFVSMQFHYTGQILLEWLTPEEQELYTPYLKVMDDHMYMPLRAAYEAAANHDLDSPALIAVQHLLPITTKIAQNVARQVSRLHPNYRTINGRLTDSTIKISSIRDAEMFQVYLCLTVLEGDIQSVLRELFPLCVLLYPRLQVSWQLVQDMLQIMGWEMQKFLQIEDLLILTPYLRSIAGIFSDEVFQN